MPTYKRLRDDIKKSVIIGGFRHTVESPRYHYPESELWLQSTSARGWDWMLYDWSRWFDIHTIGPQSFYPGIQAQRPDVLAWYYKQGSERPIYLIEREPNIIGSVTYPIKKMTAQFGAEHFGCQLDYMAALALSEGFERLILYGIGEPYTNDRTGAKALHWARHHGTFLYWLRLAQSRGVDIVFDTPESNLVTYDMIADEEKWPTPPPCAARYGYDMSVDSENWLRFREDASAEHPFANNSANG